VTIFASEDGVTGSVSFELAVTEEAPLVSANATPVTGRRRVRSSPTAARIWTSPARSTQAGVDGPTLSASFGTISMSAGPATGTWSWTYTAGDEALDTQHDPLTVTAFDGGDNQHDDVQAGT